MLADEKAVYLDVRSPEEFAQGHPAGAFNLPIAFLEPGRGPSRPNPEFVQIASRHFSTNTVLLVGCLSGSRSLRACEILGQAGFTNLSNVQGGFGGGRDRSGGLVLGWRDCDLPTGNGHPSGRSYTHLTGSSD
jgi:rhodanese-related sulfurtransferase